MVELNKQDSVIDSPGRASDRFVRFLRGPGYAIVSRLFRPTILGWEHLPSHGPFLLVANHSAGLGLAELASFAVLFAREFDTARPLAGFAHPIGFRFWPMTALHAELGTIPSTYEDAYRALEQGVPLLVFPGGDHETMRPVWQANRVDFGGRRGFLRIAKKTQIPVVPMGIQGSHYTAPILFRARALAWIFVLPRILGIKRWCFSLLGVSCAILAILLPIHPALRILLAWAALTSPLMFLPIIPWKIRFRIGEPLVPEELFAGDKDEELEQALALVQSKIQLLVDEAKNQG